MEWLLFTAPVPNAVEFTMSATVACLGMLVAVAPVWVVVCHALRQPQSEHQPLPRHVITGDKQLRQRAA
ncbi:MAG: hypothetical protein ACE5I7_00425 [Candidatus Binatia bacterium]